MSWNLVFPCVGTYVFWGNLFYLVHRLGTMYNWIVGCWKMIDWLSNQYTVIFSQCPWEPSLILSFLTFEPVEAHVDCLECFGGIILLWSSPLLLFFQFGCRHVVSDAPYPSRWCIRHKMISSFALKNNGAISASIADDITWKLQRRE